MTEESYSAVSKEMDEAIQKSVDRLERITTSGFERVERSMNDLVTKGQFEATVQRLDARDEALEKKVDESFQALRAESEAETKKTRWLFSTLLTCAGVISGVIFGVLQLA